MYYVFLYDNEIIWDLKPHLPPCRILPCIHPDLQLRSSQVPTTSASTSCSWHHPPSAWWARWWALENKTEWDHRETKQKTWWTRDRRTESVLTDGHERSGIETGSWKADSVDGENSHLVPDALNHTLGFVRRVLVDVEIKLRPSRWTLLLSLHQITWETEPDDVCHWFWFRCFLWSVLKWMSLPATGIFTGVCVLEISGMCYVTSNRCVLPFKGAPPSNFGGSQMMVAQSSPTPVHFTFSGGSGTSATHQEHHVSPN